MTARTDAAGCFRGLKQVSQGNPQGLLKVVEAYVRRKKRALLMALNVVCCETETSIRVEGLAKVGVHRDQSAAAVLGRVIAQLDHRTNVACRIDHMSQVRLATSLARRPALAASKTITRLRRGCRVQLAKTRRSLKSPSESIFACLPATTNHRVDRRWDDPQSCYVMCG